MTADPRRLADFWAGALGLVERRDDESETILANAEWTYPRLTFQKIAKSSMRPRHVHLDLTTDDRSTEIARLCGLGAQVGSSVTVEGGWGWTVMTDPDGNEFCVTDP